MCDTEQAQQKCLASLIRDLTLDQIKPILIGQGRDGGTGRRSGLKIVQDSVKNLLKSFKISNL
jgi:hypothetical protein